jgi:hypothetical protein
MISVFLVTNGGSGEDGDEWILDSIHATRESAEAMVTIKNRDFKDWEVEEWDLEGGVLTDEEREAVSIMADIANDPRGVAKHHGLDLAATLRGLLERTK